MQTEYLSNDVPRAGQRCEAAPKLNKRRFDQRDNEVRWKKKKQQQPKRRKREGKSIKSNSMRSVEGKSRKTPTHIRVSNGNDFEVDYRLFFFSFQPSEGKPVKRWFFSLFFSIYYYCYLLWGREGGGEDKLGRSGNGELCFSQFGVCADSYVGFSPSFLLFFFLFNEALRQFSSDFFLF